jgi:hypothetical protein
VAAASPLRRINFVVIGMANFGLTETGKHSPTACALADQRPVGGAEGEGLIGQMLREVCK